MARIWYPLSVQAWRGKWQSSCGFFQVLFLKPLKLSGSFLVVRLDKVCSIKAVASGSSLKLYPADRITESSVWLVFSWLHHLSFTELANKLACCSIVRADALLSTCKTHSSTAYVRKLEAQVSVSAGPVGCFPPKLLSDHRKLVYSGLLLVSNWLHLFATMYRVARNTTGPVCYQKNSKGLSLSSSPQLSVVLCPQHQVACIWHFLIACSSCHLGSCPFSLGNCPASWCQLLPLWRMQYVHIWRAMIRKCIYFG